MLIRVLHKQGHYDYVKPGVLDSLIERQSILSFYRSSGVVVLGVHPVRQKKDEIYLGGERRCDTPTSDVEVFYDMQGETLTH